ncbi:MAG: DUF1854 domain-containing protein [Phycisphaerae bacterium]|nr:DUF1854 domain-containing protein [Phycisphaerae bacterium]
MTVSQKNEAGEDKGGGEVVLEKAELNPAGQLVVHVRGRSEPVIDARVARCFPWSLPDGYVSIRDADGNEISLLETLEGLDDASRQVLDKELADKVFNPKIRRIVEYKHEFGVISITVETDRGEVTFQIRSRHDIRILSPTRGLFRDADGNTYELEDLTALDAQSRKWLQDHF